MHIYWVHAHPWLFSCLVLAGAVLLALFVHQIVYSIRGKHSGRKRASLGSLLAKYLKAPTRFILPLLATGLVLQVLPIPADWRAALQHAVVLGVIAAVGWGFVGLAQVITELIDSGYDLDAIEDLAVRRVHTQVQVIERIVVVLIAVVTLGAMLMTFPSVRHLGTSVLASAGLAGLVAGIAARSTLSSLIAGLQVAVTQPIRIGDAVVVEGEWGWIEEIRTTYVVVRIWDLRRLILPLSYFIEKPFQNWTHTSADLLGTVMLYADYTVPVEELREELHRILASTDLWDGKAWGLQVTDLTERSVQVRALMSATNASKVWDLRCLVREKLIKFLQEAYPQCLPRYRGEFLPVHDLMKSDSA
ncbi:MAG: mechanosensitive ion channel family protein [Candidatus Acidiferrum sp.]